MEPTERQALEHAIHSRRLTPKAPDRWVLTDAGSAEDAVLLAANGGACVFHDDGDGGCRIQHALGHRALPLACRQFPRQSVRHPAGVSVTLSHYCPTAAELLMSPGDILIVQNAPAFPPESEYVGLTADPSLPPLVHPRLAMDWQSWWEFERLSIGLLNDDPDPLPRLRLAVERVREWPARAEPLLAHVRESFTHARAATVAPFAPTAALIDARCADTLASVPDAWQSTASDALSAPAAEGFGEGLSDGAWRRFVAAHAFANWNAYLGEGLRTWYRSVEAAACLLARTGDSGRTDLVLRHLADPHALAVQWNRAEGPTT